VSGTSPDARPKAVLLGGQNIAVSVARALGRAGVSVVALGDGEFDTVGSSRHCSSFVDLGSGDGVQERWLEWLLDRPDSRPAVLFPCNDDGLELVLRNRSLLTDAGYLPAQLNDEVALAMLDKRRTYELAREAGVGTPHTRLLRTAADVEAVADEFDYPCALKPVHSHLFARRFGLRKKILLVDTPDDLRLIFSRTEAMELEMIVTEIIPGDDDRLGSYWTYRTPEGTSLFELTKRKLRQYPTQFGLGTYHVTDWNPRIAEAGRRFSEQVGLEGIVNIEFKLDPRDDVLKLIECNQRFTLANEIFRCAGIDLPVLAYRSVIGDAPDPIRHYRTGVHLWFPVEDARAFISYRRNGELTGREWARTLLRHQHFPLLAVTDPGPALASWAQLLGRALRRLVSRNGPDSAGEPGVALGPGVVSPPGDAEGPAQPRA
jgi:D-aspartate ligase